MIKQECCWQILLRGLTIDCNLNNTNLMQTARFIVFSSTPMVFVYLRRKFFMRILGGTRAATSGEGYLWVKSLQANWELGDFSPVLLENLIGNNFTCCASKCASSGSLTTYVNKNLMQDYSPWISKNIKLTKYSPGPTQKGVYRRRSQV